MELAGGRAGIHRWAVWISTHALTLQPLFLYDLIYILRNYGCNYYFKNIHFILELFQIYGKVAEKYREFPCTMDLVFSILTSCMATCKTKETNIGALLTTELQPLLGFH